jgi:hypothetical protein
MNLLLMALSLVYLWAYLKTHINLPDWLIHFILLPGLAYGLTFVPHQYLTVSAVCGIVLLIDTTVHKAVPRAAEKRVRRQSNIPPLP